MQAGAQKSVTDAQKALDDARTARAAAVAASSEQKPAGVGAPLYGPKVPPGFHPPVPPAIYRPILPPSMPPRVIIQAQSGVLTVKDVELAKKMGDLVKAQGGEVVLYQPPPGAAVSRTALGSAVRHAAGKVIKMPTAGSAGHGLRVSSSSAQIGRPKLAAGGIAQREVDITAGERGKELILPLRGPAIGLVAASLLAAMPARKPPVLPAPVIQVSRQSALPHLELGGIVTRESTIVAGERGHHEAIVPLVGPAVGRIGSAIAEKMPQVRAPLGGIGTYGLPWVESVTPPAPGTAEKVTPLRVGDMVPAPPPVRDIQEGAISNQLHMPITINGSGGQRENEDLARKIQRIVDQRLQYWLSKSHAARRGGFHD